VVDPAATAPLLATKSTHLGVVAGLAMGPLVGLGLGRFAYALLLPAMRVDLDWSYAQAGVINTANAVGYLIGALLAAPVAARIGNKRGFLFGLLATAASLLATGSSSDYATLAALRAVAGAAGALSLITGGVLAAAAGGSDGKRPALALGLYFAGAGFGMVVSAFTVPVVVAAAGWRIGWFVLGALSVAATLAAAPALAHASAPAAPERFRRQAFTPQTTRRLLSVLASYVLFGAGYIAYVTFIVAFLRTRLGFGAGDVTQFWACVGITATAAGMAWGPLLGRGSGGRGIAAANAVAMCGTILPVLTPTLPGVYASAVLFGGSFLMVPTAVTAFVRSAVPPRAWTETIAALTAGFALGQCFGPWLSGVVSDTSFGISGGLLLSGSLLAGAAATALLQPDLQRELGPQAAPPSAEVAERLDGAEQGESAP
jgi:predicted MFS family arabinose efflux permease